MLDDLRWIDDGIRDGFKGLASFLGTNCILSGVALTGYGTSSFTYTAGYILLNGEVLAIDASATPLDTATNTFVYVEVVTTYDAAGLKVFEDSTTADTYQIRKAVITAYSTAQAGKTTLVSLKTAENLTSDMIVNYTHSYTKRQSWALGADDALVSGSNAIPLNNDTGNCFTLDIAAYDTPIARFSAPMPNGTWSAIRFSYTLGPKSVIITGDTALSNGIDTNGKSYLFNNGEIAWFIWIGGKARLVNGWRLNEPWVDITCNNGVSGTISLRVLSNGDVAIMGQPIVDWGTYSAGTVFATLPPPKYLPARTHVLVIGNASDNDINLLSASYNGNLSLNGSGTGTVQYTINGRISTL